MKGNQMSHHQNKYYSGHTVVTVAAVIKTVTKMSH